MTFRALLFAILTPALMAQLTDAERDEGWVLLFDGKSSEGWLEVTGKPFPQSWTVEDGCLRALQGADGNQDLRTVAEFTDFDLRFEWRIAAGGNSGVKYMVQRVDEWERNGRQARARGPEYQLTDDTSSKEAARDRTRGTASLYSLLAPTGPGVADRGFHQSRIVKRGREVEHWLDGTMVLRYNMAEPKVARMLRAFHRDPDGALMERSPVCLQNHNSDVWFRNLRIRPLR